MKLTQAINIAATSVKVVASDNLSADELMRRLSNDSRVILAATPKEWQRQHLSSPEFVLRRIPLNLVAAPYANAPLASAVTNEPIVVDINHNRLGHTYGGIGPGVIVVQGVERFHAAAERGDSHINAWVGSKAAKRLNVLQCDDEMSADEINDGLMALLQKRYRYNKQVNGLNPVMTSAWIMKLYPYELYFIYKYEDRTYRQHFVIAPNRTVAFEGPATEVQMAFPDKAIQASRTRTKLDMAIEACQCIDAKNQVEINNDPYVYGGNGVKYSVPEIFEEYNAQCQNGYKPNMAAVAPPGWEGTVKHLKKHAQISNPYALAWYLRDQGDTSHLTKSGKKK